MPVDPAEFFQRLEESGLLSASVSGIRAKLPADVSAKSAAEELVRLKLLTAYQARVATGEESAPLAIGDYIVEDVLGRGGMGFVLKARHRRMKRQVAIKFLHRSMTDSPDLVARFEREVEAAAQLHHQNIVTAYDAGEHEGNHYLVMQYVEGEDLSHRVKRDGPFSVAEAVDAVRQAAEGLAYAHDKGIVHRDIKPGNLLLDDEGVVRILDMGLARMRPSPGDAIEGGTQVELTNTGSVMGTVDYMAPEQALDAKTADLRADIYSLGCTLYFLLTGNPPFRSDTIMRRLLAHREQDVPLIRHYLPTAPPELDSIFARMMAKRKEDRYPSAKQLAGALASLELGDTESEPLATIDAPDDGTGGFIKLPDADQEEGSTGIADFNDLPATTPAGDRASDATPHVADVTLIESDSQVSQTAVLSTGHSKGEAAFSDEQLPDITVRGDSSWPVRRSDGPPWKVIIPILTAPVAAIVIFVLSQVATDEGKIAKRQVKEVTAKVPGSETVSPDASPGTQGKMSSRDEQSADRRAAGWVLSIGGRMHVDVAGVTIEVTDFSQLPDNEFTVIHVSLEGNADVTDEGLGNLKGLRQLSGLGLWDTSISDAGLANLTDSGKVPLPNLNGISLQRTQVTDVGLRYLTDSPIDSRLMLESTAVSDPELVAGFSRVRTLGIARTKLPMGQLGFLQNFDQLNALYIDSRQWNAITQHNVPLSDLLAGVHVVDSDGNRIDESFFEGAPQLTSLDLHGAPESQFDRSFWESLSKLTRLTDLRVSNCRLNGQQMALFPELGSLRLLRLQNASVDGNDIARTVSRLPNLETLGAVHGQLTDDDVPALSKLKRLRSLELTVNKISAEGIRKLHEALPGCRIISDHGTFEPAPAAMNPDRRAAEWVLSIGGNIGIDTHDGTRLQIEDGEDLPEGSFVLRNVSVQNLPQVTDDGLMNPCGCAQLASLYAYDTAITDQGLANLTDEGREPLLDLKNLFVARTAVTEKGLNYLAESKGLTYLDIESNPVSDGSFLGQFRELETAGIALTKIPADDLSALKDLPRLWQLSVDGRQLQAAGGEHVSSLSNLKSLLVRYPGVAFDGAILSGLKQLTKLELLELPEGRLDELVWSAVGGLPNLSELYLGGDGVEDVSIGKMPALSKLRTLRLKRGQKNISGKAVSAVVLRAPALKELVVSNNELNDGDVAFLGSLSQLERLTVTDNDITATAIESLRRKLPNCRIESDHGTFMSTVTAMSPDRRAAEAVLKLGGTVCVGSNFQEVADLADLPIEPFVVTRIDLSQKKNIEDQFLANFRGLAGLQILTLTETSITDRGLADLTDEGRQPLPALKQLDLDDTKISQTGLQFLSGSHDLSGLMLDKIAITEAAFLDRFPKLRMLSLGGVSLSTDELQRIARLPLLDRLTMDGQHLTESMAGILAGLKDLRALKLRNLPSDFEPGHLSRLASLTELYVNADDSEVFDERFWNVVAGLEELHILMCKGVTDDSLAKAPPILQVEVLIVMSRVVTGEAVAKSMSKFPKVASLTINYSNWNDDDVEHLHSLKSLGKLDLTKNSASVEAIKALSAALPECHIISDHGTFGPTRSDAADSALRFDGVDDFVDIPSLQHEPGTPITIEATISDWGEKYGMICGWRGCAELVLSDDQVGAGFGTTDLEKDGTHKRLTKMSGSRTVRLALVYDTSEGRLFANGKLLLRRKLSAPLKRSRGWYSSGFTIGAASFGDRGGFMAPVKGIIDEVRVSRMARYDDDYVPESMLKADEHTTALYHFDSGQGTVLKDSSSNGHDGMVHGATWVRVPENDQQQASTQPVREAIEWLVSTGGWCSVKRPGDDDAIHWNVTTKGEIPDEPFVVLAVGSHVRRPADGGPRFEPLHQLRGLNAFHTNSAVTPEDLEWLQNSPDLHTLVVHETSKLNDDWAAWLQQFSKLRRVPWTHFGDAGLAHLSKIRSLEEISLHIPATANGIRLLASLPKLRSVDLQYGRVTPELVAAVAELPAVRKLIISWRERNIEPAAWKEIEKLTQLETLWLISLNLDDNIIPHLQKLTKLGDLQIQNNEISRQGVEQLRQSLPLADIKSDYGVFESARTINRRAAEWILKNNGSVVVKPLDGSKGVGVKPGKPLPESPFQLHRISLSSRIPEAEFVNLQGLKGLEAVFMNYFPLTDAALANLQDSSSLRALHLEGTRITDDGLDVLKHFPRLEGLKLPSGLTEAGLAQVLEKKGLKYLGIGFKSERVNGLSRLSELTDLYELSLSHADLSYDGDESFSLDAVRKLPGLKTLHLGECRIDARCLQELASITHLTDLAMMKCQYDGDALNELSRFEHLEKLQCPQSGLTDEIVPAVSRLKNLKSLNIRQNNLTPEGIATLRKALPDCRIDSDHGQSDPSP